MYVLQSNNIHTYICEVIPKKQLSIHYICQTVISLMSIVKCYCKKKKFNSCLRENISCLLTWLQFLCVLLFLWLSSDLSLFTSKTGERVFQTCRVLGGIIGYGSSQCIIWKRNMPHLSLLHRDTFAVPSL